MTSDPQVRPATRREPAAAPPPEFARRIDCAPPPRPEAPPRENGRGHGGHRPAGGGA